MQSQWPLVKDCSLSCANMNPVSCIITAFRCNCMHAVWTGIIHYQDHLLILATNYCCVTYWVTQKLCCNPTFLCLLIAKVPEVMFSVTCHKPSYCKSCDSRKMQYFFIVRRSVNGILLLRQVQKLTSASVDSSYVVLPASHKMTSIVLHWSEFTAAATLFMTYLTTCYIMLRQQ